MKHRLTFVTVLLVCFVLGLGGMTYAWAQSTPKPAAQANASKSTPGQDLARTISLVTGLAISPLLGAGAVGAYHWWQATPEKRPRLPWFARPWFWVPALLLVGLVGVKDVTGPAMPTALKKPFDVVEAAENKLSALLVAGAFLPLVISVFPEAAGNGTLAPADLGFAVISAGSIGNALLVPFALVVFFIVWLASHTINILILVSPFTTVDAALKTLRLSLLSMLTGLSFANPYLGAFFSIILIIGCYFLAGWSFRLTVFGTVYVWDALTLRRCRFQPGAESNWAFTARKINKVPVRSFGKLRPAAGGGLHFTWRPWLFFPVQSLSLPQGDFFIGRGLLVPELSQMADAKPLPLFIFPPRQLTHESSLARVYGITSVRDVGLLKGLKAVWNWLRGRPGSEVVQLTETASV